MYEKFFFLSVDTAPGNISDNIADHIISRKNRSIVFCCYDLYKLEFLGIFTFSYRSGVK